MKRLLMVWCVLIAIQSALQAQDRGFGLGIMIGEPTGINGKYWLSERNAIDGGVAWSFRHPGFFHLHFDYLFHFPNGINAPPQLSWYLGPGARMAARTGEGIIGIRFVGGMLYWLKDAPIDFFLEVAPIVDLAPETEFTANAGLGARFYFR